MKQRMSKDDVQMFTQLRNFNCFIYILINYKYPEFSNELKRLLHPFLSPGRNDDFKIRLSLSHSLPEGTTTPRLGCLPCSETSSLILSGPPSIIAAEVGHTGLGSRLHIQTELGSRGPVEAQFSIGDHAPWPRICDHPRHA